MIYITHLLFISLLPPNYRIGMAGMLQFVVGSIYYRLQVIIMQIAYYYFQTN